MTLLIRYDWPGNIRQLRNVLRYALAMSNGYCITLSCLPEEVANPELTAPHLHIETSASAKTQPAAPEEHSWSTMEQAERKVILDALKHHHWQILNAAKEIGIGRSTMYRKMEKYDIVPPNKR